MLRILIVSASAFSITLLASTIIASPQAAAQTQTPCGPVAYSVAEQRLVGMPSTAPTPEAEAGPPAPCGPVAYSVAEQRQVGVPCPH